MEGALRFGMALLPRVPDVCIPPGVDELCAAGVGLRRDGEGVAFDAEIARHSGGARVNVPVLCGSGLYRSGRSTSPLFGRLGTNSLSD
jgi:hypothetical protein